MTSSQVPLKRLSAGRAQCTITCTTEECAAAEAAAVARIGAKMSLPGFRPGKAPAALVREKAGKEQVFDNALRHLLAHRIPTIVAEHRIAPIIPPRVAVESREPLTITVTFVERPAARVKDAASIRIERKENADARTEKLRREGELLHAIAARTEVDLAPELVDEEVQMMLRDFGDQLTRSGWTLEDWVKTQKKKPQDLQKEMVNNARERLTLRFGIDALLKERGMAASEQNVRALLASFLN